MVNHGLYILLYPCNPQKSYCCTRTRVMSYLA